MNLIPWEDMVKYYGKITTEIYNEIEEAYPPEQVGLCKTRHSEEYLDAYGWLQKADWRLEETVAMRNHYTEPEFKYYGLENLSDVHHRIEGYLESTEFLFSEAVTDYHKYDDIISERKNMINNPDFHKYWNYYSKLLSFEQNHKNIELERAWLKEEVDTLKKQIKLSEFILNREELTKGLEEINNQISDLKIKYKQIKP